MEKHKGYMSVLRGYSFRQPIAAIHLLGERSKVVKLRDNFKILCVSAPLREIKCHRKISTAFFRLNGKIEFS